MIVDEPSKPVVGRHLLAGRYDAGLTHLHYAREYPDALRVAEVYGAVDTTWVVYGPAEALSRARHRAAQSLAVLRGIGACRGGVRARTGRGRARERPSARAHLARAPR